MAPILNDTSQERPLELYRRMPDLYTQAADRKITLSQFLEDEDPSREYGDTPERNMGALGRIIDASELRFKSDPVNNVWADPLEDVLENKQTRALFWEWGQSVWRRAQSGGYTAQVVAGQKRVIGSDEFAVGSMFRPYTDAAGVYGQQLTPGLSLDDIIAFNNAIDSDVYRQAYLVEPAAASVRWSRIGEKADIPRANITMSTETMRLYKYGRGIEMSYEAVRRVPVDKVGLFIAKSAIQVEADRVAQAIDVALNGDGGTGTSADNFNQSTLDTGSTPTVKGFLAFKSKFRDPYSLKLIVAREAELVALQMLQMPNSNPFFTQIEGELGFGSIRPLQARNGQVVYFAQSDAVAAGVYLGLDTSWALERITEIGSNIEETMRFIERQTTALFFTENDGFGVLDKEANKTWTMA